MTPLASLLRATIAREGPIGVDRFMAECLTNPEHGYYTGRDPLGLTGDFITAPEISQIFGELIGLWAAVVWQTMGSPACVRLIELGPGRGTLMADFLRAARQVPDFLAAIDLHLVEASPVLRSSQNAVLREAKPTWHDDFSSIPAGPALIIANEFFDALPIRQYIRRHDGWHERLIGLECDQFSFTEGSLAPLSAPPAMIGEIFEVNVAARAVAGRIGARLAADGGAALIIDYGHPASAAGDTLQAVSHHHPVGLFEAPGESDLTAHVDFEALAAAAKPARATEVVTQGAFLRSLGIGIRAERLIKAVPQKSDMVISACRRLIEPTGMGTLFKVRALTHPGLPPPPGFAY